MKLRSVAFAAIIALFSIASRADSCTAGTLASIMGTSCTIGNALFTFSTNYAIYGPDPASADSLIFTPSSTATGFNISGMPGGAGGGDNGYAEDFTVAPLQGTITSFTAAVNGPGPVSGIVESDAFLQDYTSGEIAGDYQFSGDEIFDDSTSSILIFNGQFGGDNVGIATTGNSADYAFNTTTNVPDASGLSLAGITALAIIGSFRKRFRVSPAAS